MRHHAISIRVFAAACGLLASAGVAQAAVQTWISGTGTDSGSCQIATPCRTFAFAHSQTNGGGSINVLTAGNFGPLTITKPISIVAQGVEAMINTGAGGAGIIVQAADSAAVSLRGLTIDMRGAGNGISFVSGGALHVQDTVIRRASNRILFLPTGGQSELYVKDSVIADATDTGVLFVTQTGVGFAVFDRVRVENSVNVGFFFAANGDGTFATVRDSIAAGSGTGIIASPKATVMIERSSAVNNSTALSSSGNTAVIRMGDSTVTGNDTGLFSSDGGQIISFGTNRVEGNATNGAPTSTVLMK